MSNKAVMGIRKIVLDIRSAIHAHNMERMLMQELEDCQVVVSESPDSTAEWCKLHKSDVLLMEVKDYSPWMFPERMEITKKESVRQAKRDGFIDAFLFGSVSENYFASVIDSV